MKILITGKGGREHALVQALAQSPSAPEIFCFPGSDAIHQTAKKIDATDFDSMLDWAAANKIDLVIAGEEAWLVTGDGLANRCEQLGIPCWGPRKEAAQLEASKAFAKEFMQRHRIPTARATLCSSKADAIAAIDNQFPTVLKFDGLAAGKGVAVCADAPSAEKFLDQVFTRKQFGSGHLLVEQCLVGPEISIFAAVADDNYLVFTPARDYKRIADNDQGPNTGGMGAVASRQLLDPATLEIIETTIIQPTLAGLKTDDLRYRGFLYFGLMLTPDGPQVIEYNCRFGDPECQAVMPLVSGDFAQFCLAGANGLIEPELLQFSNDWSVCLVMASAGYPATASHNDTISGLDQIAPHTRVYHAGTKLASASASNLASSPHGNIEAETPFVTAGGRVLALVATAPTRQQAVATAYQQQTKINFAGAQFRTDIGTLHFQ